MIRPLLRFAVFLSGVKGNSSEINVGLLRSHRDLYQIHTTQALLKPQTSTLRGKTVQLREQIIYQESSSDQTIPLKHVVCYYVYGKLLDKVKEIVAS